MGRTNREVYRTQSSFQIFLQLSPKINWYSIVLLRFKKIILSKLQARVMCPYIENIKEIAKKIYYILYTLFSLKKKILRFGTDFYCILL